MTLPPLLPKPIADYVAANARLDVDGMLKPFAPDAVFLDNGSRHAGYAELRTFLDEAVVGPRAVFVPDTVRHENGKVVVEGPTHGEFKGSPIRFTYTFTLEKGAITVLDVTL